MSGTLDALKRAEQDRKQAETAKADALAQLGEDVAALRVTVHSLEDRVELEMGGLSDELRQSIAKGQDLAASRGRAVEERLVHQLGWLTEASARGERRLNVVTGLVALTALVVLFRC